MSIKAGKSRASSGGGSTNRAPRASASRRPSARAYGSGLQARLSSPAGEHRKWNQAQHSHRIRQGESIAGKTLRKGTHAGVGEMPPSLPLFACTQRLFQAAVLQRQKLQGSACSPEDMQLTRGSRGAPSLPEEALVASGSLSAFWSPSAAWSSVRPAVHA